MNETIVLSTSGLTKEVSSPEGPLTIFDDINLEVREGEAFLVGAHISPYSHGNRQNHDPERPRKLLLKRREIDRIFGKTTIQGLTCVPLAVYLKGRHIKAEIAIARGRKLHDKRLAEKKKVLDREAQEAISSRR